MTVAAATSATETTDTMASVALEKWRIAGEIIALVAACPRRFGGVVVRGGARAVRDVWFDRLKAAVAPAGLPMTTLPAHISRDRLVGGLDFAATLAVGRTVHQTGVLESSLGGILVLPGAERLEAQTVALVAQAMDDRARRPALTVCFDESLDDEEPVAQALRDRCAFVVDLEGVSPHLANAIPDLSDDEAIAGFEEGALAGNGRAGVGDCRHELSDDQIGELAGLALAFGVDSLRVLAFACEAASASAIAENHDEVTREDLEKAARLVILPRATQIPEVPADDEAEAPQEVPPDEAQDNPRTDTENDERSDQVPDEQLIDAVLSKLPAGLIDELTEGARMSHRGQRAGKSGAVQKKGKRGRAYGSRAGRLEDGARVNLAETLIAAAPWQKVRSVAAARGARAAGAHGQNRGSDGANDRRRIDIRPSDVRLYRHREKSETVAVFVVDASGSAAAMRLAEAKGAIERLLAENYARRDQVALIAMQGKEASLLMAPTRSLVRAKRQLALLPGGGGTPLAHGLDQARLLCEQITRRGQMPVVVMLTDGQANIARSGEPGRAPAEKDALDAARALAFDGVRCLVIDVAYRKQRKVEALAAAMRGTYLLLPQSGGATVSEAVRSVFE